ncbi:hypothetical protein GGH12_000996 [Coemansia sp. RSA 1822]|nr:hypothetical protein LPJ76_003034 [Coemansia sp. RSA 638]KAJ2566266.1 hypothetical protein GGH12_000996 [Coemansia sp. RSA 1822]
MSVILQSLDKQEFTVSMEVAQQSMLLKDMIAAREDAESPIVLKFVLGSVLAKVIEYCEHHQNDSLDENNALARSYDISSWDYQFLKADNVMLALMTNASKILRIERLRDLCAVVIGNLVCGKTDEEISTLFNMRINLPGEIRELVDNGKTWTDFRVQDQPSLE